MEQCILGYRTEFFSLQNNPKILYPSYKMDLDLSDCTLHSEKPKIVYKFDLSECKKVRKVKLDSQG